MRPVYCRLNRSAGETRPSFWTTLPRTAVQLLLLAFASATASCQAPDSLQREAVKKLDWWVGRWQGVAWNSTGQGRRDTTVMTETIRKDLDGTIMVIEGLGKRKLAAGGEGPVVHHALAVISFDEKKGTFRWQSWRTPGGLYTETEPVVSEGSFQWGMDTPRGKIRYAGKLDGRGHWVESGEFSSDGNTWHLFFGMDLSR